MSGPLEESLRGESPSSLFTTGFVEESVAVSAVSQGRLDSSNVIWLPGRLIDARPQSPNGDRGRWRCIMLQENYEVYSFFENFSLGDAVAMFLPKVRIIAYRLG